MPRLRLVWIPYGQKIPNACCHSACCTGLRAGRCGCPRWVELLVAGLAVIWRLARMNFLARRDILSVHHNQNAGVGLYCKILRRAGCALHGLIMVKRNTRDFADLGLDVINPWSS